MKSSRCPLVACSDVIGSSVTDILMLAYRGLTMDRFLMGGTPGHEQPIVSGVRIASLGPVALAPCA
jgi:hypothetical protein